MNRLRSLCVLSVVCIFTLIACGPRVVTATTSDDAKPSDSMQQPSTKPATPASATAKLEAATPTPGFSGTVTFTQAADGVHLVAHVQGVPPGRHALHLHENGQCAHATDAAGKHFTSAGGHFNPKGAPHACPPTEPRHAGDFGMIEVGADGTGHLDLTTNLISLGGDTSVIGKAVILHAGTDDCTTQPTGNAGDRLGCGVVSLQGN
jgi:superoxide dismutase, Cu-Zn family